MITKPARHPADHILSMRGAGEAGVPAAIPALNTGRASGPKSRPYALRLPFARGHSQWRANRRGVRSGRCYGINKFCNRQQKISSFAMSWMKSTNALTFAGGKWREG